MITVQEFSDDERSLTVVTMLETERALIPTTFIPLAPDKIFADEEIDLLYGVFHIMWRDMPSPRTYRIRLAETVSRDGIYNGCKLKCGSQDTPLS